MENTVLTVRDFSASFGDNQILHNINLDVTKNIVAALMGPSGCGKTTILRLVAGFEGATSGSISIDGRQVTGLPPERRNVNTVFQSYALFPHMTVAGNVGFGLRRASPQERAARVAELLELVGLSHAQDSYPHELSGGQQQRVALARALAPAPELLLLDEPFSNLDTNTREHLAQEVRHILQATGHTAILVTHNQAEALAIADHIGSLSGGQLQYWDSPSAFRQRLGDEQKQKKELLAA